MNKKIIIIGSSVSMPRNEVSYEDTWVSKFISTFNNFNIIDRCKRASLSTRLINEGGDTRDRSNPKGSDLLEFYKPNFSIIELAFEILPPNRIFKSKNRHIGDNVNRYNTILSELEMRHDNFQLLRTTSSFTNTNENYFIDELHPNNKGHEKLFEIINSIFSKINE